MVILIAAAWGVNFPARLLMNLRTEHRLTERIHVTWLRLR